MFLSVCDVGPLSILSQPLCSMSHVGKCFMNLGIHGSRETKRTTMYCKKLKASLLCIDFGLILTNLACSVVEALLIPAPARPWLPR